MKALVRQGEIRLQIQREALAARREALQRRQDEALRKNKMRWLQAEYPRDLAMRLVEAWENKSSAQKKAFEVTLSEMNKVNWFRFLPRIPPLWEHDASITLVRHSASRSCDGGPPRNVRYTPSFATFSDEFAPGHILTGKEVAPTLGILLDACGAGFSRHAFSGGSRSLLRPNHFLICSRLHEARRKSVGEELEGPPGCVGEG